mgnify:CR=1 FL=1
MSCRSLTKITKGECESNKGGLFTTVWVMTRSNLDLIKDFTPGSGSGDTNPSDHTGIINVAWKGSYDENDACTLKYRKQSSGLTSEATVDDANGISFVTSNLALVFARQNIEKRIAIQALALQEDLAVIVRDGNGVNYFLGADDSVTATAYGANTGTAATDANNYTITLTDISSELPYIVTDDNMEGLFGANWKDADLPTQA